MDIEKKIISNFYIFPLYYYRLISTIFVLGRNGFFFINIKTKFIAPKNKNIFKVLIYVLEKIT